MVGEVLGWGTGPAAGIDALVGGDAKEPGAEGSPPAVKGGQGPEDGQENLLGQVHGVLLVAGLAVGKAVDLVIVGPDELVCRLG